MPRRSTLTLALTITYKVREDMARVTVVKERLRQVGDATTEIIFVHGLALANYIESFGVISFYETDIYLPTKHPPTTTRSNSN